MEIQNDAIYTLVVHHQDLLVAAYNSLKESIKMLLIFIIIAVINLIDFTG